MDRVATSEHLEQARRHIAVGEQNIIRQRALIAYLEQHGHPATGARQLLASFEDLHVSTSQTAIGWSENSQTVRNEATAG